MPVNFKDVEFKYNLDPTPQLKTGCKGGHRGGEWSGSSYCGLKSSISANLATMKVETTSEDGDLGVTVEGPGLGAELGASLDHGVAAMAEARVAQLSGQVGPLVGSVGLNANTGFRLGGGGVQVNVLGFGFNLGVGGRVTADTPFGSAGVALTNTNTHRQHHENNTRTN